MKLLLIANGTEGRIEILRPAPECRFRIDGGPEHDAQVEAPEPGVYSILMNGRSYDARVEEAPGGILVVVIDGFRFEVEVRDPRRRAGRPGAKGVDGVQSLTAPMPGKVVRVLVNTGDAVEAGQGLVVVEAMKMQNEIKAPRPGRVLALPAREGATVAAGEVLATIG
jgi:biotin carboxyl carrier protein